MQTKTAMEVQTHVWHKQINIMTQWKEEEEYCFGYQCIIVENSELTKLGVSS